MSDIVPLTRPSSPDLLSLNTTPVSGKQDETPLLKVNDEVYEISQGLLAQRPGIFRDLFAVPQRSVMDEKTAIHMDVDEPEWTAFVWFLTADPLAAVQFSASPASIDKCARYLGIAVVAHRYDAIEVAEWAIGKAQGMLKLSDRSFQLNVELARLLVAVSSRWREDAHGAVINDARDLICDALSPARAGELAFDPISALDIARDDTFVLAHVYFYILRKGFDYTWSADPRVKPVDRLRLLCGAYSLSRQNMWGVPGSIKFPAPPSAPVPQSTTVPQTAPSSDPLFVSPVAPQPRTIASSQRITGSASPAPPALSGRAIFDSPARAAPHTKTTDAFQPQAPLPWSPEIDVQIAHVREELWGHFDEARWALSV